MPVGRSRSTGRRRRAAKAVSDAAGAGAHVRGLARAVRRAAQPAARDGRGPEPARPDRPPAARPARRAGADLRPAARGRGARGAGPAAGPARRRELEPDEFDQPEAIRAALCEAVEPCIPIAPPIRPVAGTRRVVALVGPTGVGKTTTVAKLAANFKLAHGVRAGLVTVDTYRIAAVEQLRTYAEIIDLPLAVANDPGEMRRAIDELGDVDLVLIDTAGRSPRDEVKIRELADFLPQARPDEVHLVLERRGRRAEPAMRPSSGSPMVQADRLILTKLDEADGLGGVLAVLGQANRPVSYLTTGQAVPDDIEPADRTRLARLILETGGPVA